GGANAGNAGAAPAGSGGTGATSGGAGGGGGQGSGGEAPAAPCEASEAPDEKAGVFVDPRLGDDANEGTIVRPFQTVERAANEAAARGVSKIYLAPGSYQEALSLRVAAEQAPGAVSAPEGTAFSFEGGWTIAGTRWQRDCAPDARENTVLASPSTTGVSIRGAFGPIAFRNLSIATVTAAPPAVENEPGVSCYGVNASGAALRLRFENVEIDACPGGPGGPVTAVTPPPDPPTCGFLSDPAQCADASPGADATGAGAPAPAGAFTDEGYAAGIGEAGPPGEQGKAGVVGPGVAAPRVCSTSDSLCCITTTERQQGRCGCGGYGGPGGLGGRGGGASIAIFLRGPNASLDLAFATLRARDGGAGEVGKDGEPGFNGGLGAAYGGFGGFGCCDPVPDPNLCECTGLTN
ncbi:MAG TPA: hypothetical protein VFS00_02520, partial [Polyangiaceae bacterium]|nr:hypothetical protein [Polyangiaceae bacterium]